MAVKSKTPAGLAPGPGGNGNNAKVITDIIPPKAQFSQADTLSLYESEMAIADSDGDLDRWLDAYMRWLDLHYQIYVEGVQ